MKVVINLFVAISEADKLSFLRLLACVWKTGEEQ